MDRFIPGFSKIFGDEALSIRLMNIGAPKYDFNPDIVSMKWSWMIMIYNEDFSENYCNFNVTDSEAKFKMSLRRDFWLYVDWISQTTG